MRRSMFAAGLLLAGCGGKLVKVDPALAALAPADTVLMVDTRVEALLKTPVYRKHLADWKFAPIEEFARQTGLDPRTDLSELLFVSNGRQPGILLGRGKFALEKGASKRFDYKGFNLIGNDQAAVVVLNSSMAAAGETMALRSLIDHREKSSGPPPALAALIQELPADAQFWAAYTGGPLQLGLDGNLGNVTKLLGSIQSGTVYFDLRTGLNGVAAGTCSTEQDARQVHDALKALAGLGRLSAPKDQPELLQAYDSIRVTLDSRRVKLYLDMPQEVVDKFLRVWFPAVNNPRMAIPRR